MASGFADEFDRAECSVVGVRRRSLYGRLTASEDGTGLPLLLLSVDVALAAAKTATAAAAADPKRPKTWGFAEAGGRPLGRRSPTPSVECVSIQGGGRERVAAAETTAESERR